MSQLCQRLLISGCGGDIGMSLGRIAKAEGLASVVIGCDMTEDHPARKVFDEAHLVPAASSGKFLEELRQLIRATRAELFVPTSEAELATLMTHGTLDEVEGARIVTPGRRVLTTGLDKLATIDALREAGLPFPWTRIVGREPPDELPCIVKPRSGQGGKGVLRVEKWSYPHISEVRRGDLWQEFLGHKDSEHTCGVYRTRDAEVRSIIFKRQLSGGRTGSGEVVECTEIDKQLIRLAETLDLRGSMNVQLRTTQRGPVVFEINPRFSSTVGFRHRLGFTDFLWALQEATGSPLSSYRPPKAGTRIYRGSIEYIVPPTVDAKPIA